ncbi:MAG: hypothetical protein AAFQ83_02410 [Bacteroidota bacterium]
MLQALPLSWDMLLVSTVRMYEYIYFFIFIACAVGVYYVLVQRVGDMLPRKTIDQVFFVMLGTASFIWVLSKLAPTLA